MSKFELSILIKELMKYSDAFLSVIHAKQQLHSFNTKLFLNEARF